MGMAGAPTQHKCPLLLPLPDASHTPSAVDHVPAITRVRHTGLFAPPHPRRTHRGDLCLAIQTGHPAHRDGARAGLSGHPGLPRASAIRTNIHRPLDCRASTGEYSVYLNLPITSYVCSRSFAQELAPRLPNHSVPVERRLHSVRLVSDTWSSRHGTIPIQSDIVSGQSYIVSVDPSQYVSHTSVVPSLAEDYDDDEVPPLIDL